jgi:NADPH:quinone reductase-like Zn-dependent oxidoreductase
MRAVLQERYGSPDVLRLAEVDMPAVAEDEVLVRVRAASVNAGDWRRVRSSPFVVRLVEGVRRPRSPFFGADVAGVVEDAGGSVNAFRPGEEVMGLRTGALAEYVSGRNFVAKPAGLTFEEAAAIPLAGTTALQAVRDRGGVQAGQRVLVTGAGGGVGTFVVQIAKAFGADVTAVTRTENVELVRSIGADRVVDYTREDFTRSGERYDVIIDVAGAPSFAACRRALTPDGTLVVVGAGRGRGGPLGRMAAGVARARVLRQRIVVFIAKDSPDDLRTLLDLVEAGKLKPVIDRAYPLSQTADALRYLETGRARGKVVITVSAS